jgi:hypothetical protein
MCYKAEHMKHTVTRCTTFGQSEYTNRHSKVAGYIHWKICKHLGSRVTDNYYEHIPETVINVNGTTIMWDVPVFIDRTILAYRSDTVVHSKNGKTCLLIEIAAPDDSDGNTKEIEKLSRYKHLEIDVSKVWKVRIKTV